MYQSFQTPAPTASGSPFRTPSPPTARCSAWAAPTVLPGARRASPRWRPTLGVRLAVRQVHGAEVAVVDARTDLAVLATRSADALLTTRAGVGLAIRVADCVPVLFADAAAGV